MSPSKRMNPNFFERTRGGIVRVRIGFTSEEADRIELAAGPTALMPYLYRTFFALARHQIRERYRIDGGFHSPFVDDGEAEEFSPLSGEVEQGIAIPELRPCHRFPREGDGTARVKMRFQPHEAALLEEAAEDTPIVLYLHRITNAQARRHIAERKRTLATL